MLCKDMDEVKMADKLSDNVGKKIVEALKMQQGITEETLSIEEPEENTTEFEIPAAKENVSYQEQEVQTEPDFSSLNFSQPVFPETTPTDLETAFQNSLNKNLGADMNFASAQSDFEYPNNVAILNHLISKLPVGVTKQTGAVIIRQTMEALGISMKSVIQEAQQVQDSLSSRARECQKNIIDFRKQIATLEVKAQQYQRQAVSMNDIINLFVNTGV